MDVKFETSDVTTRIQSAHKFIDIIRGFIDSE
jgi:hypothetical protein